jgi:hypothetical protein
MRSLGSRQTLSGCLNGYSPMNSAATWIITTGVVREMPKGCFLRSCLPAVGLWRPANRSTTGFVPQKKMLSCRPCHMAYYGGPVVRVLSLAFDLMFFSSLAFPIVGFAGNEFTFLPIIFVLGGIIVQAFFLRQFRLSQRRHLHIPLIGSIGKSPALAETKICRYCDRAISADAKICRFCLTRVDENTASSAQVTSLKETEDLHLQNERWRAATTADL